MYISSIKHIVPTAEHRRYRTTNLIHGLRGRCHTNSTSEITLQTPEYCNITRVPSNTTGRLVCHSVSKLYCLGMHVLSAHNGFLTFSVDLFSLLKKVRSLKNPKRDRLDFLTLFCSYSSFFKAVNSLRVCADFFSVLLFKCLFYTFLYLRTTQSTLPITPTNSMLHFNIFPVWLTQVWQSIPFTCQIPVAGLIFVAALSVARTLDGWVRSLRKDPIALASHISIFGFIFALAGQIIYFGATWLLAPFSSFTRNYHDACNVITTIPLPYVLFPKTYLVLLILVVLGTWWIGQLVVCRWAGNSTFLWMLK